MKKIEYKFKERKFLLVMDNQALLKISKYSLFDKQHITRCIEPIQEFDFEIIYIDYGRFFNSSNWAVLLKSFVTNEKR